MATHCDADVSIHTGTCMLVLAVWRNWSIFARFIEIVCRTSVATGAIGVRFVPLI